MNKDFLSSSERHLMVDGVSYDVSNLFSPTSSPPATRGNKKLVPRLQRWRSEKSLYFSEHVGSTQNDMKRASIPSSIDVLTSQSEHQTSSNSRNSSRNSSRNKQPGASYVRMVPSTSQEDGYRQHRRQLKQPPTYPPTKHKSLPAQSSSSRTRREETAPTSPKRSARMMLLEVQSPQSVVSDITMSGQQPEDEEEDVPMVEIEPGVHEPLRGAKETASAIRLGTVANVLCICCTQEMMCIQDAAYFLCPTCKIVGSNPGGDWGVGLGFIAYDNGHGDGEEPYRRNDEEHTSLPPIFL